MRTVSILVAALLAASASATLAQQASVPTAAPAPAAAVTPANDPAYTYKTLRLNRAAFDALNARPEQLLIVDLRRPDELTKNGGFPVYFSLQPSDVQRSLSSIPRDRLIVTVSNRAHRADDMEAQAGENVADRAGAIGVLDYQDEGGVLTKLAPPVPRVAAANTEGAQQAQAAPPAAQAAKP